MIVNVSATMTDMFPSQPRTSRLSLAAPPRAWRLGKRWAHLMPKFHFTKIRP
jgi:hypothetical protein